MSSENKAAETAGPSAKKEVDFATMTSARALKASGKKITGYRNKRELFEKLRDEGVTVKGL